MNDPFRYSLPGSIKNYKCLREVALWAGGLGVAQSIIWIGLTLTGILAYNCIITVEDKLNYGSLIKTIFIDLYFRGDGCEVVSYNNTMLSSAPTVLNAKQLLIWNGVYMGVAVCWLIVSVNLMYIKKDDVYRTCGSLIAWAIVMFCIAAMDTALGVIFAIDYGRFSWEAYNCIGCNLNSINSGDKDPNAAQLLGGMVTAISLMIISFKGFVLWIINVGLMIYLLAQAVRIALDKDGSDTLFMPRKQSDDILTHRPPIQAYEDKTTTVGYTNDAFVAESRSIEAIELNQDSIARAARMSTEASLDRRFRNLDAFQQYPPSRYGNRPDSVKQEVVMTTAAIAVTPFPAPDYSPPMERRNQTLPQNGGVRGQRYQ